MHEGGVRTPAGRLIGPYKLHLATRMPRLGNAGGGGRDAYCMYCISCLTSCALPFPDSTLPSRALAQRSWDVHPRLDETVDELPGLMGVSGRHVQHKDASIACASACSPGIRPRHDQQQ
ncbi:hypothetical protein MRB53_040310 [Persea americana]|nr:hypothetical protein MRB53_040310 [Persea americana]